ncbi:hypothetical protein TNCV_2994531 [Trichonephila clavipes]|nr:hypothetical protein TNCV_2994531 [Trichonephila clavipes]
MHVKSVTAQMSSRRYGVEGRLEGSNSGVVLITIMVQNYEGDRDFVYGGVMVVTSSSALEEGESRNLIPEIYSYGVTYSLFYCGGPVTLVNSNNSIVKRDQLRSPFEYIHRLRC